MSDVHPETEEFCVKTDQLIVETPMWHEYLDDGARMVERPKNQGVDPKDLDKARDAGISVGAFVSRWSAVENRPATLESIYSAFTEVSTTPPNNFPELVEEVVAKSIVGQYALDVAVKSYLHASTVKV